MAKPFSSLLRRIQNFSNSGQLGRKLLLACLVVAASGRLLLSIAQQANTDGRDIVAGWDFTGWSKEEKDSALSMLFPTTYEEWAKTASSEQIQAAERSALAIINPALYVQMYPVYKDPAQRAAEAQATYAITHPVEWQAIQDLTKTKQQRDEEQFWRWAMTHPEEYAALVNPLKTDEDWANEQREMDSMSNLQTYPPAAFPPPPPAEPRPF